MRFRGGEKPRFDERRRVGGEVHLLPYRSSSLGQLRTAWIYVPREAVEHPARRLPVLYLRHGGGDFEGSWVREGRVAEIMDNLIAEKAAVPMYVVMTNGLTDGSWAGGSTPEGMQLLERELIEDVIPLVENRYPVCKEKRGRAIAGLSMGGGQAFVIGLRNLDLFSAIGQFSAGILSDGTFDYERYIPGVMEGPGTDQPRTGPAVDRLRNEGPALCRPPRYGRRAAPAGCAVASSTMPRGDTSGSSGASSFTISHNDCFKTTTHKTTCL